MMIRHLPTIRLVRCRDDAVLPARATTGAFGYDLQAVGQYQIEPGTTTIIQTGWKLADSLPPDLAMLVLPRSSLSLKKRLLVSNSPGLIDRDYTGELGIVVYNLQPRVDVDNGRLFDANQKNTVTIEHGERIAQLVFVGVDTPLLTIMETQTQLDVRGGFGSTGA